MSRFISPDLSALDVPDVLIAPNFEEELAANKTTLLNRALNYGLDLSDVINLESDPLHIWMEAFSERVIRLYGEANDQIRSLILTDAQGVELDHIAATYYGISRLVITPEDTTVSPVVEAVFEDDEDFRARIALAPEAFSTAGCEGSYIFHALELDGIRDIGDVAVYSEDDGATYSEGLHADAFTAGIRAAAFSNRSDGDLVLAPEVIVVILPTPEYGDCDQPLLDRTFTAISRKDVRPIGDNPRIEPATKFDYEVEATLYFAPGAAPELIVETARASLQTYIDERRRIGARVQAIGVAAALKVDGVQEIDLIKPAADILPGSKGYCEITSDPVITAQVLNEGWRP